MLRRFCPRLSLRSPPAAELLHPHPPVPHPGPSPFRLRLRADPRVGPGISPIGHDDRGLTIALAGSDLLRGHAASPFLTLIVGGSRRWPDMPRSLRPSPSQRIALRSDTATPLLLPSAPWLGSLLAWDPRRREPGGLSDQELVRAARAAGVKPAWAAIAGGVISSAGSVTEQLWHWLAGHTFAVVEWTLRRPIRRRSATRSTRDRYANVQSRDPPECSGYEGIGRIVGFLSVYLLAVPPRLRFPVALVLRPIGAATIWIVNALRIVALVAIGTSGWPAIARGASIHKPAASPST